MYKFQKTSACYWSIHVWEWKGQTLSYQRGNYEGEQYGIWDQRGKEEVMWGRDLISAPCWVHYWSSTMWVSWRDWRRRAALTLRFQTLSDSMNRTEQNHYLSSHNQWNLFPQLSTKDDTLKNVFSSIENKTFNILINFDCKAVLKTPFSRLLFCNFFPQQIN